MIHSRNRVWSSDVQPVSESRRRFSSGVSSGDNGDNQYNECLELISNLQKQDYDQANSLAIESINRIKYFLMPQSDIGQQSNILDRMSQFKSTDRGTVGDLVLKTKFYAEHSDHYFIYQDGGNLSSIKAGSFRYSTGKVFISGNVDTRKLSRYLSDILSESCTMTYYKTKDHCNSSNYHHSSFCITDKPGDYKRGSSGGGILICILFIIFLIIIIAAASRNKW